ncbi:M1 family metallopeptidase [Deminuibacter soli]|uniref:Aminopeptidase N n=1 Tax=Deminuibacter soli TaxID=2291815 RepID=A0A3E1NCJ9_9BACT|nr:M1 family metallopeptidase [Deminuibacter soli]RFM25735.1 M1 family peptidase [Deminuibacter soli]
MKKLLILLCAASVTTMAGAQAIKAKNDSWKKQYRYTDTKINDLVHTKLDVRFDYDKAYMYGKAWITLQPHFYPTDSLNLDAKGMNINEVALINGSTKTPLQYTYDSLNLRIQLGKTFKGGEKYTVYIDYVSKPDEFKTKGSAAITDAKGLYFINPRGENKDKPTQIWTQGETEATSVWCPTIDRSTQKTTEEISMTVPAKYVTLSNGLLTAQKKNADGTRTDTWKMDLPHSPYLFFMGVGDYAIVKDSYKGKEVSYYVEPAYEKVARRIFGNTPEMIAFYSRITGVDFPWPKYAQITGRDYVSGAMENTTATLHQESAQQNARELVDGNDWESTVAHELFHQWFGDLATCESWSNLTLNESFANYSETLWSEYKYGADAGAEQNYTDMQDYLRLRGEEKKDLVRFYYADKEDMFDAVSYNKGGRILHMLRHYVGDSAFFKSLNVYLSNNKFKSTEAQQLRLAFEEVTGQDLNWYWNQWYYGSGHPKLDISYAYDNATSSAKVFVKQTQQGDKLFKMPVDIDVYANGKKTRHQVWIGNAADTFALPSTVKPDLINFDGDKILLAAKEDHKTLAEYIYQYTYAGNYVDRREALDYAVQHIDNDTAKQLVVKALNDPYKGIRSIALKGLAAEAPDPTLIAKLENMAQKDASRPNRALAIDMLGDFQDSKYEPLFVKGTQDSSYAVAGASLTALADINETKALSLLPALKQDAKGELKASLDQLDVLTKTDADFDTVYHKFTAATPYQKFNETFTLISYLSRIENVDHFKTALDAVTGFSNKVGAIVPKYKTGVRKELVKLRKKKASAAATGSNKQAIEEQLHYLDEKLAKL